MQCTVGLWSCILANAVKQSFVVSLLNFAGRCYCERFRSTQLFILTQHCNCNCADKCCCKNCFLQPWSSRELQRRSAVKFCWLRKNELLVLHWVCSPLLMKFTLSSWTRRWTRSWTRRWWVRGRRHIDGDTGDRGLLCQSVNVRRNLTKGCHLCHQRLTQK